MKSHIVLPLNSVADTSKYIAEGDFTTVINKTTQDQIGQVADNFSSIQMGLSKVLSGIIKDVNQLGVIIDELFAAF